jgi:hypothetical protein
MDKKAPLPLQPGEKLLRIYRETELVLTMPALIVCALIYIPWFFFIKFDLAFEYRKILLLWTMIVALYALRVYILWHLKEYIITTKRLIHISHYGMFKKQVIETPLERILNVSFQTTGLTSSLFRFGDVEVQVVGLTQPIVLKNIKQPGEIKDYLWQLHSKYNAAEGSMRKSDIPTIQEKIGYAKSNDHLRS